MMSNIMEHSFKRAKPLCLSKKNMYHNILTVRIQKNTTSSGWEYSEVQLIQVPSLHGGKTKKTR